MPAELRGKIYDFGGECPKCKALDPMRHHCRGCKMHDVEHLDHLCLNCGFAWPGRTADGSLLDRKTTKRKKGEQTA